MELEGVVPNTPNIAVSICYIDAIFLCNELVTVFFTSCSEGSLTHVSGFVLTTNLILFPDMDKYRGSFSILLTTKVKIINYQTIAYFRAICRFAVQTYLCRVVEYQACGLLSAMVS